MRELRPEAGEGGMRVDAWLAARFPEAPKASVRRALAAGCLTLRGRPCAKGERVEPGAAYVLLREPGAPAAPMPNGDVPLEIVWEDAALIALRKPAGLDCQPNGPEERGTLANALLARRPEVAGVGDGPLTCGLLHRIDRDTSGLVLAARAQGAYDALRAQFVAHAVEKRYLALAAGEIRASGRLEHLLAHNPRAPGRMVDAARWRDAKRPMRAVTVFRPLRSVRVGGVPCTLLEVTIRTGVTHQIRAQLSFAGHPLVGDRRYGGLAVPGFPRHFLHALSVSCAHPATGAPLFLEAPPTDDLVAFLRRA